MQAQTQTIVEAFIGRTNREAGMPADLCGLWEDSIQKVFRTGEPADLEFDFPTANGARTFYLKFAPERGAGGSVDHVLGVSTEITKLKQAEEALRQKEAALAEAQRIARIGSWEWNVQTGEVQWSAELYFIYGLDPATFTPTVRSFADYVHPDDGDFVNRRIGAVLAGDGLVSFDFRIVSADARRVF